MCPAIKKENLQISYDVIIRGEEMADMETCRHQFTFTKEDLFNMNPILSKKKCELCGETIVLERKSKIKVTVFITLMVLLLIAIPDPLKAILPGVSFTAKMLVAALLFVVVYAFGIYRIMSTATYKKYEPPKFAGEDSYEESKKRAEERTREFLNRRRNKKIK